MPPQLKNPAFFGYLFALLLLNVVWRRADLGLVLEAFNVGYRTGKQSQPLFGADWNALWSLSLGEVRKHFEIPDERLVGEGIRTAA